MKRKTIVMSFMFLLVIVQKSIAQEVNALELENYQNELMIKELSLNEEQVVEIQKINKHFSEKQANLINSEGSMLGKIGDVRRLKKEKNAQLQKVLTKSQMEQYEDDLEPKIKKYFRSKM